MGVKIFHTKFLIIIEIKFEISFVIDAGSSLGLWLGLSIISIMDVSIDLVNKIKVITFL